MAMFGSKEAQDSINAMAGQGSADQTGPARANPSPSPYSKPPQPSQGAPAANPQSSRVDIYLRGLPAGARVVGALPDGISLRIDNSMPTDTIA